MLLCEFAYVLRVFLRVRVRVRVCMRECVCAFVFLCARARACVGVYA